MRAETVLEDPGKCDQTEEVRAEEKRQENTDRVEDGGTVMNRT